MAYEMDPKSKRELNLLIAGLDARYAEGSLWDCVDLDVVADPVPEVCVWTLGEDGDLDVFLASVWTWEEAIRFARGSAIISGRWTRVTCLS